MFLSIRRFQGCTRLCFFLVCACTFVPPGTHVQAFVPLIRLFVVLWDRARRADARSHPAPDPALPPGRGHQTAGPALASQGAEHDVRHGDHPGVPRLLSPRKGIASARSLARSLVALCAAARSATRTPLAFVASRVMSRSSQFFLHCFARRRSWMVRRQPPTPAARRPC